MTNGADAAAGDGRVAEAVIAGVEKRSRVETASVRNGMGARLNEGNEALIAKG
jgi:hypothetical protein